jgi:cytochrome b subunit of formate dehydrogenase
MNLNWIKHRDKFIFALSSNVSLSVLLYVIRKDFAFHWILALLFAACLIFPHVLALQKKLFLFIGYTNSKILLTVFYFLFFTPFSWFYKLFYKHESFRQADSQWVAKDDSCNFNTPF